MGKSKYKEKKETKPVICNPATYPEEARINAMLRKLRK